MLPDDFYWPSLDELDEPERLSPSEFVRLVNEHLRCDIEERTIVGEVTSLAVSQGKWVFFDLKDEEASVKCFLPLWKLRVQIEDGMKIAVTGTAKLTTWGRFSVTVRAIQPMGEGSLKKAYEKLKKKLTAEGLFDPRKKRGIPENLERIGVISSTQAAGYADFVKILNERWGGMKVMVAHTQVQGIDAPDQIIRALKYFNERSEVQMIAIIRGGGSADDLSAFNDELLVREIAASKIPVITGIGHEVDESLSDLAADVRASTPSNVAQKLSKDRKTEITITRGKIEDVSETILDKIKYARRMNSEKLTRISDGLVNKYIAPTLREVRTMMNEALKKIEYGVDKIENTLEHKIRMLEALNPENVLRQGYAIISGKISPGDVVKITTFKQEIKAEVKEIYEREKNLK